MSKIRIRKLLIVFFLQIALLVGTVGIGNERAWADSLNTETAAKQADQAAEKVVQDKEEVKKRVAPVGEKMIDKARETAQKNIQSTAQEVKEKQNSGEPVPPSKEKYLQNLQG